ncbi:amidohydrolase [Nocardioides sp. LS1]|uniref:amidohydrolase n=1 Tax=Nocardioides sp. LS1 TaxID=1027620 RepID=UPI000FFAD8F8|nr:amidohydrolase [Nocardioides sp. LS1]GCD88616.1 amidohydrolase [Nocardioides sp. LS1]
MSQKSTRDTVYLNGRFYTADSQRSWCDAVLVRDGAFAALGSAEDVRDAAEIGHEVVDLDGRMAMPGIHDGHTHLLFAGLRHTVEAQISPMADGAQVVRDLMASARFGCAGHQGQEVDDQGWLVAGVLDPTPFPEMRPDRAFLDEAFPDRPVMIYDWSMHHLLVNARALELSGIDEESVGPPGGQLVRRDDGRSLSGELVEHATWPVQRALPQYAPEVYRRALTWAVQTCNRYGITSVQEASATAPELRGLAELDGDDELTLHVAAHLVWRDEGIGTASMAELETIIAERDHFRTDHVDTAFVKFFMDGVPLPPHFTACELVDNEPENGKILIPRDELGDALRRFDAAGLKVKIHCAAAGAVRVALDEFEKMRLANGPSGPRHEVAHTTWVSDVDLPRFAALNIGADMSPAVWSDPQFEKILATGYRFATMQDHAVQMTVGTDWAVTATPNLFPALEGMLLRGQESLALSDALQLLTIKGAEAVRRADRRGSVEVGKSADFIVLDRNLFEVPLDQIGATTVLRTVFEGRTVYERPVG